MVLRDTLMTTIKPMSESVDMDRFFSLVADDFWPPVRVARRSVSALVRSAALRGFGDFRLDGARMMDQAGLFREFSRSMHFPDYFGSNCDALDECLADLDWLDLPGYVLLIDSGRLILCEESEELLETFNVLMRDIAQEWATSEPGVVFRTVIVED